MGMALPGLASGIDPKMIEQLIEIEKMPVESAKKRKAEVEGLKEEFNTLQTHLTELDSALNGIKTRTDFYRLKVESSHPDIIDGTVASAAMLGSYEFEVRGMARSEKELAYGFPDKDETPVGFGYMLVERDDKDPMEIVIEPNSTLQGVANQINDADAGVRAMVVNTKYKPDAYRLLVVSEASGKESRILIDEDTTFLEFKEQVTGRNLDVLFEDVPVTDEDNTLDELVDGVVFNVKRSEPGTRIQVSITHDLDATLEGVKEFVDKYNAVSGFINKQFVMNDKTNRAGTLAGDSSIKTVMRQLQNSIVGVANSQGKYRTLADIGITTNPKTGTLDLDETKVRQALAEDYDSVAQIFIRSKHGDGVGERMSAKLKGFRDPGSGVMKSKLRGLDSIIKNADKDIERRERNLAKREETIRRKFSNLESTMAGLQSQGQFLAQRFGGSQGAAPGGAKKG